MQIHRIPAWVADTNCYVVELSDSTAVIVDAPPDAVRIGDFVAERGLSVGAILLTHGHIDHSGGAGDLAKSAGASVYVHPDDDFLTLHPEEQLKQLFGMVPPGSFALPESFTHLTHGQVVSLGGLSLEVLHTPGHTPGHCCFLWREEGLLFSGDQLFAGSIGRTDLPGGSMVDLMTSMRDRVMSLDDEIEVLPGHGPGTTIGAERVSNPFRDGWA